MLLEYLLVAIGGALGTMARFWIAATMTAITGPAFPWGTLIINVVGSFAIGVLSNYARIGAVPHIPRDVAVFTMVGICGGFTTFSSFSLQTLDLARGGKLFHAGAYILSSVVLCLVFVWVGARL